MPAETIVFPGIAKLDLPGEEFFASSIADGGSVLWPIERFKAKLLAVPESEHFAKGESG